MEKELKKYLIEKCRNWMLPEELNALRRLNLTQSGEESTRRVALKSVKLELVYGFSDDKTNELVLLGREKLELAIAGRLLEHHESEVINNCPKCEKLTRTPFAKQCRFCGHDWH